MKISYTRRNRSRKGELSDYDIKSLVKQAFIAITGALIPVIGQWVTETDWGVWGPTVFAGWTVLANILRKATTNYDEDQ